MTLLLPPDPCVNTQIVFNPAPWPSQDLEVLGQPARLFEAGPSSNPGESPRRHDPFAVPWSSIVDASGFGLGSYGDLSAYLAAKGFLVVVIDRPTQNGPTLRTGPRRQRRRAREAWSAGRRTRRP